MKYFVLLIHIIVGVFFTAPFCFAKTGIITTKHNLSATGLYDVKALSENRVCIFCHTPHNASPGTPLWNKSLEPTTYILYESSTLASATKISPPYGPTRLCLSCHDGTVALGKVLSSKDILPFQTSDYVLSSLGQDISDDHPVAFSYYDALPNSELASPPPADLLFYNYGHIHCTTCHDPHDDTYGMFLAKDNRESMLCTSCHVSKEGWINSSHRTSTAIWNGIGQNPWPRNEKLGLKNPYYTVRDNGCMNCHKPHSAGGKQRLLTSQYEEEVCFPCHDGAVATKDIKTQFNKISKHDVSRYTIGITASAHDPVENTTPTNISGHVECVDCHNPHAANERTAQAPYTSGASDNVTGVDQNGSGINPVTKEYEICFKCHADTNQDTPKIQRVVNGTNTRLDFSSSNPSFHPVIESRLGIDAPSLNPASIYRQDINAASQIYCTDCHGDDSVDFMGADTRGPHGSNFAPILRERYETTQGTTEDFASYALCYRCHNRQSLIDDTVNQLYGTSLGHPGHLGSTVKAPCSACHDPHGVPDDIGTGSHTHLINFDTLIVTPAPGETVPFFTDNGMRAGSCTLTCHDAMGVTKIHVPGYAGSDPAYVNSSYP